MGDDSDSTGHLAAQAMLDSFASVGATRFDLTRTTRVGQKKSFRRNVSLAELATHPARNARRFSRPAAQRDRAPAWIRRDVHSARRPQRRTALPAFAPAVFLALETSPGNFQAWVAMPEREDKDFARRVRKGTGADPTASGATRVAGSLNFKDKYAPNFPRVAIRQANLGPCDEAAELERLGLVAAPEIVEPQRMTPARSRPSGSNRKWPSYARCLDGAPLNSEETGPDTSRADFVWCMTAITWGWTADETARTADGGKQPRPRRTDERYAELTARNAALRRGTPPAAAEAASDWLKVTKQFCYLGNKWTCYLAMFLRHSQGLCYQVNKPSSPLLNLGARY